MNYYDLKPKRLVRTKSSQEERSLIVSWIGSGRPDLWMCGGLFGRCSGVPMDSVEKRERERERWIENKRDNEKGLGTV